MRRQLHGRATSVQSRTRSSSAERYQQLVTSQLVRGEVVTAATVDAEQRGRLRRVRSFTTRSGTVVNRGDSFKVRHSDGETRRGRDDPRGADQRGGDPRAGVVAGDWALSRPSRSAAATASRHGAPPSDYDDVTSSVVTGDDDVTTTDTSYTVVVLGSDGVGKTTIIQQLLTSEYLANKDYNVG